MKQIVIDFSLREWTDKSSYSNRAVKHPRFTVRLEIEEFPSCKEINDKIESARKLADKEAKKLKSVLKKDCYFILHSYTRFKLRRCSCCNEVYSTSKNTEGPFCSDKCSVAFQKRILERCFG